MAESILSPVKPCIKCGLSNRYPSGKCKPCGDAASKKRHQENPDLAKAYRGKWYEANKQEAIAKRIQYRKEHPEQERETMKKWDAANKEKIAAKQAEYREKNKERLKLRDAKKYAQETERCKAYNKAWYANNPDAVRIKNQNRRARILNVGGKLSKGLSERLFDLQKGKCPCCKRGLGKNYHLDHIVPLALGGSNDDSNAQLLRAECNLKKHAEHPVSYMQSKGFLL
jgi:5-methylcytosine-specific restriction endonuclease McrA